MFMIISFSVFFNSFEIQTAPSIKSHDLFQIEDGRSAAWSLIVSSSVLFSLFRSINYTAPSGH